MMNTSQAEGNAMASANPGEVLRQARESKGWSTAQVATQLKLTEQALRHLEQGAFEHLPGHTFTRGYIRAYAKLLGLEQEAMVSAFDRITGTDAKGSNVQCLGRVAEPVRLSRNLLRIFTLLLLLLLLAVGYVWWQDHAQAPESGDLNMERVEVDSANGTTEVHRLDEPEEANLPVNPEPTEEPVGTPTTTPSATPETPSGAPANPPAASSPAEPSAPLAAGQGRVQVQYSADCWTEAVDASGKVLFRGMRRKEENLDLVGKLPIDLRLGYARGAQVTFNGQPVDLSSSGETARLKLGAQ